MIVAVLLHSLLPTAFKHDRQKTEHEINFLYIYIYLYSLFINVVRLPVCFCSFSQLFCRCFLPHFQWNCRWIQWLFSLQELAIFPNKCCCSAQRIRWAQRQSGIRCSANRYMSVPGNSGNSLSKSSVENSLKLLLLHHSSFLSWRKMFLKGYKEN